MTAVRATTLYRAAIEWIALNDEDAEMDSEIVEQQLTVVMTADVFGVGENQVARDVIARRRATAKQTR